MADPQARNGNLGAADTSTRTTTEPPDAGVAGRRTYVRWVICALLFFATTINYIDRQVLGILAPTLQREMHWSETQYSAVVSWFTAAYAIGFLFAGRLLDKVERVMNGLD